MRNHVAEFCSPASWSESLRRPETVIALIVTCGFLVNIQQGTDTNAILRHDPLIFKGIRVLTIVVAASLALWTVLRRRIPYTFFLAGALLPFTLYFCSCVLSVPFSAYPLLSLFKAGEIGLVVLLCAIGITSETGSPAAFFHLNVGLVLLYTVIIWIESAVFPGLAWVPLRGETPWLGYALSGVFPVINGNTVGLFGAVLFLACLPRLFEPPRLRPRYVLVSLLGLASVICSYSRTSLLGLVVAALFTLVLLKKYVLGWALLLCLALVATSGRVRTLVVEHLARGQQDHSLDTLSSHRLTMWEHVLSDYRASVVGRGYAAGFRYDDDLTTGNAHNSLVELYFNLGLVGTGAWLVLMGTVARFLARLLRSRAPGDDELVSVAGTMVFLMVKAMASTVFVYLDASMLILAGIVIYVVRRLAVIEQESLLMGAASGLSLSCR
jgi:O-antigen ligase